jgi:hypothetical protein
MAAADGIAVPSLVRGGPVSRYGPAHSARKDMKSEKKHAEKPW